MASWTKRPQALLGLITFLSLHILTLFSLNNVKSAEAASSSKIAVYWGQNSQDGSLADTCDSGLYDIVVIAYLSQFGCNKDLKINLASCTDCTALEGDIRRCQNKNVKVFLSIGGPYDSYSLCPSDNVAEKLYKNFLSNQPGPLGTIVLDGIDFRVESSTTSTSYWDELAKALDNKRKLERIDYSLSASPHCIIPDAYLGDAIKTNVFDYLFIQFYNNPRCQYSHDYPDALKDSWKDWSKLVLQKTSIFFNLPAAIGVGGYVPPADFVSTVLPYAKKTSNYGGVALWDRGNDKISNYTAQIKPDVVTKTTAALHHHFMTKKVIEEYYDI